MANIASAKKRARQSVKRRLLKTSQRSMLRTHMKNVNSAIEAKDKEAAIAAYKIAVPSLDQAANKGLIHKNKAARHKSHLNTRIRDL